MPDLYLIQDRHGLVVKAAFSRRRVMGHYEALQRDDARDGHGRVDGLWVGRVSAKRISWVLPKNGRRCG